MAGIDRLSPIDRPGHSDEGLPECPGGGHHPRPCQDYRFGAFHVLCGTAAKSCPTPQVSFAPLLPVEDAFVGGSLLAPRIALDVGGPPDCRPSRVALRI